MNDRIFDAVRVLSGAPTGPYFFGHRAFMLGPLSRRYACAASLASFLLASQRDRALSYAFIKPCLLGEAERSSLSAGESGSSQPVRAPRPRRTA